MPPAAGPKWQIDLSQQCIPDSSTKGHRAKSYSGSRLKNSSCSESVMWTSKAPANGRSAGPFNMLGPAATLLSRPGRGPATHISNLDYGSARVFLNKKLGHMLELSCAPCRWQTMEHRLGLANGRHDMYYIKQEDCPCCMEYAPTTNPEPAWLHGSAESDAIRLVLAGSTMFWEIRNRCGWAKTRRNPVTRASLKFCRSGKVRRALRSDKRAPKARIVCGPVDNTPLAARIGSAG